MVKFILDQLTEFQPRDDYKELLQLSLYYLDEELPEKNDFRKPGAYHRAKCKWVPKIIYSIKVILFQLQFELKETELSIFSGVPLNDLYILKDPNG